MPDADGIVEVTAPVEFEIVDDRLLFTVVSGARRRTFSISFHKARNAAHIAIALLDQERRKPAENVSSFHSRKPRGSI